MMLDATQNYAEPISADRLFAWPAALFPTGYSGMGKIVIGRWRDDAHSPMQAFSGPMGHEHVHFEAPKAARLQNEMAAFLDWFNRADEADSVLSAGIAHLWFVTMHPFDDGNGRIARAITDLELARSENIAQRFYSMSARIRAERAPYENLLERTQRGTLDITPWLEWFLGCLHRAFDGTEATLANVVRKAQFWELHKSRSFNERQRTMSSKLLDGFEGKLNSSKWSNITKCSTDTAFRDIHELVEHGILVKNPGGGRATSYSLAES